MSSFKKNTFFWASYADLMTSLFFVVLVLFVLTSVLLQRKVGIVGEAADNYKDKLEKIEEIQASVSKIDPRFFTYNDKYKKHVLNIKVGFFSSSYVIEDLSVKTQNDLVSAGRAIRDSINNIIHKYPETQYLIIIEGQASKDKQDSGYDNELLSYNRARALKKLWDKHNIIFNSNNCELIVSGSGTGGNLRENNEVLNQRFLIQIIPKPGKIDF